MNNRTVDEMYGGTQKRKFFSETITAEQARIKTATAAKMKAESELMPVFVAIDDACKNGLFTVNYEGDLSKIALDRLSELGYRYLKSEDQKPIVIKINWEK